MLAFRVNNIVPPGNRYFYVVEETGVEVEAFTPSALYERLRMHYTENQLAMPSDIEARVMDFMCRRLPPGFCYGTDDGRPRAKVLTLQQIRESTSALVRVGGRVDPGVARQRIAICGRCPKNDRSVCPTCVGLVAWAKRLVRSTFVGVDEWLGVCAVDGTALPAKVHVRDIPENPEYPETCWRTGK